jgi:tetratricopeptide (TPR) repeat protein
MDAGDVRRAGELWEHAWALTERLGGRPGRRFQQAIRAMLLFGRGRRDDALELAEAFIAESEAGSPHYQDSGVRMLRGRIYLARGDASGARSDFRRAEALAREVGDPQVLVDVLASVAQNYRQLGLGDEARRLAVEALGEARDHPDQGTQLAEIAFFAGELGIAEEVRAVLESAPPSRWRDIALAGVDGDIDREVDFLEEMGLATAVAQARLRLGERLIEAGRRAEGAAELQKALEFYRSVGASFFIERAEALLATAYSDSA